MPELSVSILLSEAFSNMVLACLLEPLRAVRDSGQAGIRWSILTTTGGAVQSSSGIRVEPDKPLQEAGACDLVLLVGGDNFRAEAERRAQLQRLLPLLRSGVVIGAATGPWLLAALGLLDGRRSTMHWQLQEEFAERFLKVEVADARFLRDGRFWTCGTAAGALDLILLFIEERFGPAVAYDASAMFVQDGAQPEAPPGDVPRLQGRGSPQIRRLVTLMAETLEHPLPLPDLAAAANLSERSLSRLFQRELGVAPGRYYQVLRLARARDLAARTGLSIEEIALRCGFASASGLRRAYHKHYGTAITRRAAEGAHWMAHRE
jgi:transcriptional regulator GlxA family with amidase domain